MESNAKQPPKHSARVDRQRQTFAPHLRKWLVRHGRGVHTSFMCGVAHRFGDFAAGLVLAWLIARR
ncbi:hypothetical protein EAO76_41670 [Streptomyces sp. sk2.1]|nr:hypothetical protein EAO76_41670 [Streptomyces sp. sk2.1]